MPFNPAERAPKTSHRLPEQPLEFDDDKTKPDNIPYGLQAHHQETPGAARMMVDKTPEQREKELVMEAALKNGAVVFYLSMTSNASANGITHGFQYQADKRWTPQLRAAIGNEREFSIPHLEVFPPSPYYGKFDTQTRFETLGINEFVDLAPLLAKRLVTRQREQSAGGIAGLFGKKVQVDVQTVEMTPVHDISNIIPIDSHEPAYALCYQTFDRLPRMYLSEGHRPGQVLRLRMVLPESTARRVLEITRKDPTFMRQLVERSILENTDNVTEDAWRTGTDQGGPLRPPYEAWREANKGVSRMYVRDQTTEVIDSKQKPVFPTKNVIEF